MRKFVLLCLLSLVVVIFHEDVDDELDWWRVLIGSQFKKDMVTDRVFDNIGKIEWRIYCRVMRNKKLSIYDLGDVPRHNDWPWNPLDPDHWENTPGVRGL